MSNINNDLSLNYFTYGNNATKTYQMALFSSPISQVTKDQSKINENPFIFNKEVTPKMPITDQKSSGRCWIFATLNMIRIIASQNMGSNLKDLEFSQTYLYFWDKFERYHRSIQYYLDIKQNIEPEKQFYYLNHLYKEALGDGGQWDMSKDLVKKYGIVPKQAMPDSYHSKLSAPMNKLLTEMLINDFTILDKSEKSVHKELINIMMDRVYNVLVGFLGKPPTKFNWIYEVKNDVTTFNNISPHELLKIIKFNPDDWVTVVNDPRKENPYYKYYQVKYLGNVNNQHVGWINLPIERLKELSQQMIDKNLPVFFGCNVGAERDKDSGIMDVGIFDYKTFFDYKNIMNKEEKLQTYASLPSHAMVIVGYYSDSGKPTRWNIENSWGKSSGTDGFLQMTTNWYDEYVFQIVVAKSLLTENEVKTMESVHKLIEPWDPMGTLAK
jgi:bleomycin hydrolase